MKEMIRSYLPGRLRARHPSLIGMDDATVAQTCETIASLEGITDVSINPRVGSVVIRWDPNVLSDEALAGYLALYEASLGAEGESEDPTPAPADFPNAPAACAWIDRVLEQGARWIAPGQKNVKRAKRVAQNRLMLALLGASVVSLASGTYRVHAALGWSFVGLLAVHLYQHRRVI